MTMSRQFLLVTRAALLAALAVASLAVRGAIAADAVLLASTVPGYVPGMVISFADRLSIPDGASATLLFQSGEILRVRGPFEGTLDQPQAKQRNGGAEMLANMFRLQGADATVIGGTRSVKPTGSVSALDDVQIDPQRSGTYCIDPTTAVWITHPADKPGEYALRRKGNLRTLGWPPGAARIEWPMDVPIEDGSQFEIVTDGVARATVSFRAMPSAAATGAARMATGILLGCHDQFDDELHRFSRSVSGPELWITTDHGRQPIYHTGEPIALTAMADIDGYLYCVATNNGNATPIFPAGAVDGAQIHGSVPLSIPGRRQPAGLIATPGLEQIRCWLADRDITPELPHALLGATTGRLPDQLAIDLDGLFNHIGATRIAVDVLTLKTE
jgi:hypothetical protein